MSFAYPEFLFALAAISVPIIIHLFNFRRFKKVYFSDIRFLKDVEIETKSRNKLKNLLILLSRVLAVAFLVMAFARPFIPTGNGAETIANSVVVYIDNSFSMNADGEEGNLLEEAKDKAIEIGSAYANGAKLHLLTNDFDPGHLRNLTFEEFKNEVSSVRPSAQVKKFDEIVSRSTGVLNSDNASSLYFISDLQRISASPINSITDSLLSVYVIPVQSEIQSNLYIDSCWFDSPARLPSQPDQLNARIRNAGNATVENLSVKLTVNGIQRSVATATVSSQSYEDVKLPFTNPKAGIQFAEISIQDYPITYDDRYYVSFNLSNSVTILMLNGESSTLHSKKVFDSDPTFVQSEVLSTNLDYSVLTTTDLVVCNGVSSFSSGMIQELMRFVQDGGSLLFIPSERPDLNSTNELLLAIGAGKFLGIDSSQTKVEGVNLESQIFKNVFTQWEDRIDLPTTKKHFVSSISGNTMSERLLTLANGDPLLSGYKKGKGISYVLSACLKDEWTNFHRHALFVPALYNIALNSTVGGTSMETIGSNSFIPVSAKLDNSEALEVIKLSGDQTFIPERSARIEGTGFLVHDQVKSDGHYLLLSENDTVQPISFNFNRAESNMEFLSADELKEIADNLGIKRLQIVDGNTESLAGKVKELHDGKQLWRLFLLLALLCLLLETVLIRIL
jgi:hypothetical protein